MTKDSNVNEAVSKIFTEKLDIITRVAEQLKEEITSIDAKLNVVYEYLNQTRELVLTSQRETNLKLDEMFKSLKPKTKCIFCPHLDTHTSGSCANYSSPAQQTVRLTELGKCVKCLEDKDQYHTCEFACVRCRSDHHVLMCDTKKRRF